MTDLTPAEALAGNIIDGLPEHLAAALNGDIAVNEYDCLIAFENPNVAIGND